MFPSFSILILWHILINIHSPSCGNVALPPPGSQDSRVHVRPQGHGKRLCGVLPGVNGKPIVPFFIWGHEVMTSWCHDVRERHMASTWADQLSKLWELEQLPGARWGRRHGLLPGVLEEDEEGQAPFGIGYLGISWDDHGMWTLRSWLIFGEVWRISSVYLEYIYIYYMCVCVKQEPRN